MGNDQQYRGTFQHTLQDLVQGFGGEDGKALGEEETVGALQQGAGDIQSPAFPLRELPACFAHHLQQASRHAVEEGSQAERLFGVQHRIHDDAKALQHHRGRCCPAPEHAVLDVSWTFQA